MGQGFPWAPKPGSAQSEEALDRSEEAPGRPGIQLQQRNVPPQEASGDVGIGLLSGGERSLAAVALLIAIFRARPSPFYVMNKVFPFSVISLAIRSASIITAPFCSARYDETVNFLLVA